MDFMDKLMYDLDAVAEKDLLEFYMKGVNDFLELAAIERNKIQQRDMEQLMLQNAFIEAALNFKYGDKEKAKVAMEVAFMFNEKPEEPAA